MHYLGMKITILLATLVALAISEETYNSEFDDFDIQELIHNVRLLESYGKCFLYKGPCTPYGIQFRKLMPEAIRTSCAKCSPKQRQLIRSVVKTFKVKVPKMWVELGHQEDPNGKYKESFDYFLDSSS